MFGRKKLLPKGSNGTSTECAEPAARSRWRIAFAMPTKVLLSQSSQLLRVSFFLSTWHVVTARASFHFLTPLVCLAFGVSFGAAAVAAISTGMQTPKTFPTRYGSLVECPLVHQGKKLILQ